MVIPRLTFLLLKIRVRYGVIIFSPTVLHTMHHVSHHFLTLTCFSIGQCHLHGALEGSLATHQNEFYVLLTLHPGMILVNNQLDVKLFFFCMFISILYMFRAAMCPSSGELLYQCDTWFMSLCVDGRLQRVT